MVMFLLRTRMNKWSHQLLGSDVDNINWWWAAEKCVYF